MVRVALATLLVAATAPLFHAQSPPADRHADILISRQLAEARQLHVASVVRLARDPTGAGMRTFVVAGIYEPMPDPMHLNSAKHEARLHLPDLLALTGTPDDPLAGENVEAINIAVQPGVDPAVYARTLSGRVPGISALPVRGLSWQVGPFVVLERFHFAIALVTIIASTVFLLALTVMLVDERRETVGVLRLIGLTSRRILLQVIVEGFVIAGAGAVFGIALALASQGIINRYFQWRYDTALVFVSVTPDVIWRSLVIAVPLGVAGSVLASWVLLRRGALTLVRR